MTPYPPTALLVALASAPLLACSPTIDVPPESSEATTTTTSTTAPPLTTTNAETDESGLGSSESTTTPDPTTGSDPTTCDLPDFETLLKTTGPHRTTTTTVALRDRSRPTPPNGDFEGSPTRDLPTTVWMPAEELGRPAPLVLYAHGLSAGAIDGDYLGQWWASWGYIVAAPDFPLSSMAAPGGPTAADIAAQPGDLAFVIDELIASSSDPADPLHGRIDPERVALTGLSLGALTVLQALFDAAPPIHSAILLGTPSCFVDEDPFPTPAIPTLAVHGDADVVTPFSEHADPLLDFAAPQTWVARIHGGTHTGFSGLAQRGASMLNHADDAACGWQIAPDFTGIWSTVADALGGDATGCTDPCTRPKPWPRAINATLQARATAVLTLVHLDRTLRQCDDAEALWSLLRNGVVDGVDILPGG